MTNGEKFKTAIERIEAFNKVYNPEIEQKVREIAEHNKFVCFALWLEAEAAAEEENLMPCPFCGRECCCVINHHENFIIRCTNCDYTYGNAMDKEETVKVHNDLCKAVKAFKESEVK